MVDAAALTDAIIAAGCPATGIRIGDPADRSTWAPTYADGTVPTDAQRQAAAGVIAGWSGAAPTITGRQFNGQARAMGITSSLNTVLTSTTSTAKPDDIRYVNSVGLDTRMPIDNPKAARVLRIAGVNDVPGFMAAALLLLPA